MATNGRERTVTDETLLMKIRDHRDPVVKTSEVAAEVDIGATRVNQLLTDLEERGFVRSKRIGSGKAWWIPRRVD